MVQRVLIVRLGAFGDIVHTLPLAADLVAGGWLVDWLCEDRWADLVTANPAIDRVHRLDRSHWRQGSWRERRLLLRHLGRAVRTAGYAAVIDAQGLAKSALWTLLSRCPRRIGHARPRSREGAWLVLRRRVPPLATHVIDQQRALGLPLLTDRPPRGGWKFPLPSWAAANHWADTWLADAGLAEPWILNVGAGWPTKVWPQERFIELVGLLAGRNQRPVLVWGNEAERAVAQAIATAAPSAVVAPATDLPRLAALLRRGRVVVSGDTGPLHLAMAVGTPTVGLFGPVPVERNGPRGQRHINLQAPGAAWERHDVGKVDMAAITAAAVDAAAGTIA